jgi:hypothetical protein
MRDLDEAPTAPSEFPELSLPLELWRGEVPLAEAYWVWGVIVRGISWLLIVVALHSVPGLGIVLMLVLLAYGCFISIAIWRSAGHYRGSQIWALLARLYAGLNLVTCAMTLLIVLVGLLVPGAIS